MVDARPPTNESPALALRGRLAPSLKHAAQVLIATTLIVGGPIAMVWWARESGRVSSLWIGLVLGMVFSLGAQSLGSLVWEALPGSEDLLFSELMVWGYLHRLLIQRRLGSALDLIGPMGDTGSLDLAHLDRGERAKLLEGLVTGIETSDPYLHGHSRRVARHSWMIARKMGLPAEEVARIRTAAAIHDVGKINTPTAILHKPARLTDAEYEVIKRHPGDGAVMADVLCDPELESMIRHHHERLDGSGYPDALRGEEIPLGARIIAVADTFDAITSERPYRSASPQKRAINILREEAGSRLDPDVVRAFCGHYAGRAPITLSSFLTGMPERVVSWLSGSAATVASGAKVAVVAALVGAAAGATPSPTIVGAKHRVGKSLAASSSASAKKRIDSGGSKRSLGSTTSTGATGRHHAATYHVHAGPRSIAPTPTSRAVTPSTPSVTGGSTQSTAVVSETVVSSGPAPEGKTEETPITKTETPVETEVKGEEKSKGKGKEKAVEEKERAAEREAKEKERAAEREAKEKERAAEKEAKEKAAEEKASEEKSKGKGKEKGH
jgi:HD-GYP domain-containing protein (c-di-GMP phosphodiesterase class II)